MHKKDQTCMKRNIHFKNLNSDIPDTLVSLKSTTYWSLIHGILSGSEIKFDTLLSHSNNQTAGDTHFTEIDPGGKLKVYVEHNPFSQLKQEEYWDVHD